MGNGDIRTNRVGQVVDVDSQPDDHQESDDDREQQCADHGLGHVAGGHLGFFGQVGCTFETGQDPHCQKAGKQYGSGESAVFDRGGVEETEVLNRIGHETDHQEDRGQDDRQTDLDDEGNCIVDA